MGAADTELLTDCQGGWYDIAARMPAVGPRVIGFVGVSQDTIGKSRFYGTAKHLRSSYGRHLLASIRSSETDGRTPGRQFGAGDHCTERIQNMVFGFFKDVSRKGPFFGLGHITAEFGNHGPGRCGGTGQARR